MTLEDAIKFQQADAKLERMESDMTTANADLREAKAREAYILEVQRKSGRRMTDLLQYEKASV